MTCLLLSSKILTLDLDRFKGGRSWRRGTNENTNGLLRQYFSKGTNLSPYTQVDLDEVALQLNTRPRKTLGYDTPAARLAAAVASTG